jgi:hypothetical protein
MKRVSATTALLGCALFWPAPTSARAQENPVKKASDFSTVEYFDPPHQMQISSRLSGAEARPVSEDLTLIIQMKLETFGTNGLPKYVVEAPKCVYNRNKGVANSAGPLKVRSADGQVELTGVGFLWRQDDSFLNISNQVHTVIKAAGNLKITP